MSLVNNYSVICDESDGLFILNNAENRVKKIWFFFAQKWHFCYGVCNFFFSSLL